MDYSIRRSADWKQFVVCPSLWRDGIHFCLFENFADRWTEHHGMSYSMYLITVLTCLKALVIVCGGGPGHKTVGFQYWRNPGPFVAYLGIKGSLGHFLGFWTTFSNAIYAYSGVETISVAAAETQAPRRNIPIAAKRIFWRVAIFYSWSPGDSGKPG